MLNEGEDEVRQCIDNRQASVPGQFWDWDEDEDEDDDYGDEDDEDDDYEDEAEEGDDDGGREIHDEIAVESVSIPDKCGLMVDTSVKSNGFSCSSF